MSFYDTAMCALDAKDFDSISELMHEDFIWMDGYDVKTLDEWLVGLKSEFEKDFKFTRDIGITFQSIFEKIIRKKIKKKWTLHDKELQYIKRGRYAEFNLLYDRGTKFGLQTGGNVEGILMSLPPIAKWK